MVLDNGNDPDTFTCVKTLFLLNNLYHNLYPSKIRYVVNYINNYKYCVCAICKHCKHILFCVIIHFLEDYCVTVSKFKLIFSKVT